MKKKSFDIILLTLLALCFSTQAKAWGETTSYVLQNSGGTLSTIATGPSLPLTGPGATLTYDVYTNTFLGIPGVGGIYVQVSTDGGSNWSDLAHDDVSKNKTTKTHTIGADVTHIRFITKTGATLNKYYSNIKVTRATTLSTSTTSLDFGTVTNRRSSTLNASVDYNNTTYNQQVTGTCTDPNFTVTATTVGATGSGQAIPVVFTPTSAGTHTGTVTLTMNGKTVSFSVTGVGQTTYYTRATASATTGGQAFVSFTSFEAATNSSDTKNSGVTTASSASTVAYFRAVPQQRYTFVGWKESLSDAAFVSTDADFLAPAYTYTSESSSAPTVKTYYAIFEEKPNVITLEPSDAAYDADIYERVTLHRTFLQGYHSLSLPFATDVQTLTGRVSDDDWVAQLSSVTYNAHDGYTLFFEKVASGYIGAFQPYILHLGQPLTDPSWTNVEVLEPQPVTITPTEGYDGFLSWQMTSNFTAAKDMNGFYGIVNAAGALKQGTAGSTLNAFTAYITPPAGSAGVKARSAFIDNGTVTIVEALPFDSPSTAIHTFDRPSTTIHTLDGTLRHSVSHPGIYIIGNRKVAVNRHQSH